MSAVRTDDPASAAMIAAEVARTGRSCGSCSLCCKLLPLPEINKPANTWCKDCRPGKGGCAIHDHKPAICAGWYCAWMTTPALGEHWNPRISRMVLNHAPEETGPVLYIMVDPSSPLVWREPRYFDDILKLSHHVLIKVCIGNRTFFITPDREAVEIFEGQGVWLERGKYEVVTEEELQKRRVSRRV